MYLLLYLIWVAFNGKITGEICLLGVFIVGGVALIAWALFRYTPATEWYICKRVPLFLAYLAVLLWEIIRANFAVLGFILCKKRTAEASMMSFDVELETEWARFILANSITLTPGTITVFTYGRRFTVHALTSEMLDGIESSTFVTLLKKMEAA